MLFADAATDDFFRSRIDQMIDLRYPLAVLSSRMPWQESEARVAHLFVCKAHAGEAMPDLDLFGEKLQRKAAISSAGRLRVPLRVMISLLFLKHAFNESDEGVVERWGETPTWQFFAGQAYFEHRQPCDATALVKFRQLMGDEGVEELLARTINVAVALKLIKAHELSRVTVDGTVQDKAIAHPTVHRLLETARVKLADAAKGVGIDLKQTVAEASAIGQPVREALSEALRKAARIHAQIVQRKVPQGQRKLYAWHAPELDCISKGKARQPYEFGVKMGVANTPKHNLIVGARAFHGNPYDCHTLSAQMEQAAILMQDSATRPNTVFVDLGHRGVDADNPDVHIVHRGKHKRLTAQERRRLRRRQAARCVVRGGLQHQMAAAHDYQEGRTLLAAPLFAPVSGCRPKPELAWDLARACLSAAPAV